MTDMQTTNNNDLQQSTQEATTVTKHRPLWFTGLLVIAAISFLIWVISEIAVMLCGIAVLIASLPLWVDASTVAVAFVLVLRKAASLMYSRFNEPPKGATNEELDAKFEGFMIKKRRTEDDKKMIAMRKQANQLLAVAGILLIVESGIFATFVYERLDVKFAAIILALLLNAVVGIWKIYEDQIKALHWSWVARSQPKEIYPGFRFYREVDGKEHMVRLVRIGIFYVETLVEKDGSKIDILPTDLYKSGFRYRCDRRSDASPSLAKRSDSTKAVTKEPAEVKEDDVEVISPAQIVGEEIAGIEVPAAE